MAETYALVTGGSSDAYGEDGYTTAERYALPTLGAPPTRRASGRHGP